MSPDSSLLPLVLLATRTANTLAAWLLTYAIHSTILLAGTFAFASTAPGRRVMNAHGSWLWRLAVLGAVGSASIQSLRTAAPLAGTLRLSRDMPAHARVTVDITRREYFATGSDAPSTGNWAEASRPASVATTSIAVRPLWPLLMAGVWLATALGLLGWFAIARIRFLHSIGPRRGASNTLAGASLRQLRRQSHYRGDVRLTLSARLTSPVALDGGEICLPERALADLDPIRLESILAHELAHIVRRDPAWLAIARAIEAVFYFQPLNRLARRRMQEAAEFAADAWASERVSRPLDLAHCLARVAEWTVAAPAVPVIAMAEGRGVVLVRRVERLTSGRVVPESAPGRALRLGAVATVLVLVMAAPRAAVGAERDGLTATFQRGLPVQGSVRREIIIMRRAVGTAGTGPSAGGLFVVRIAGDSVR